MKKNRTQFAWLSRILHWLMAAMLLTMLFIGMAMVASLGDYHKLVSLHRPLGIAILILAVVRLINRMCTTLPPFPPTMSQRERWVATASERWLYALMLALPLGGLGNVVRGQLSHRDVWARCICRRFFRRTRCFTRSCARRIQSWRIFSS